jgi:hypothetical protein
MDAHDAVDDLLFADALDLVPVAQVHGYGVAGGGHVEGEALNLREGGLQAVPLRLVLFAAFGFDEGVGEDGVVLRVGLVGFVAGKGGVSEGSLLPRGRASLGRAGLRRAGGFSTGI